MSESGDDVDSLRNKIAHLESQLGDLKRRLSAAETGRMSEPVQASKDWKWPLEAEEYKRYGRQMIMPEIGIQGDPWALMRKGKWLIGLCARTAQSKEGLRANCWLGRPGLPRCSIPCWCWSRNPWSR